MKIPFFGIKNENSNEITLSELESRHCIKVLRHKVGDQIQVLDGKGFLYNCTILNDNFNQCLLDINSTDFQAKESSMLQIIIAPPKNPIRIDWLIEKCVEMGVSQVSFVVSDRSVRNQIKYERLDKISISSMKQSCSRHKMKIDNIAPFSHVLHQIEADQRFIPHLEEGNRKLIYNSLAPNLNTCILIGPEGDFTPNEIKLAIESNFIPVSLGNRRLRTETAAIMVAQSFNYVNKF